MELIHKLIHRGQDGQEQAAFSVELLWDGVYFLDRSTPSKNLSDVGSAVWISLVEQAVQHGRELKAKEFQFRVTENVDSNELIQALPKLGFLKKHDRIEFRASIEDLPDDQQSPITWRSIAPSETTTITEAAALLHQAANGDPDYDPKDDAEAILKSYLADPVLTSNPECIQIGYLEKKPVAIVVAQINPKSGWSRITYMGVIPAYRKKGLGKWVHRHGFKMMRDQGGKLYHGGTVSTNRDMLKLFVDHGCKEYRRMQEWIYRF
jgi:GNAT superfamily N-acetyltransferase